MRIYGSSDASGRQRARLRALWSVWTVGVRISLGAFWLVAGLSGTTPAPIRLRRGMQCRARKLLSEPIFALQSGERRSRYRHRDLQAFPLGNIGGNTAACPPARFSAVWAPVPPLPVGTWEVDRDWQAHRSHSRPPSRTNRPVQRVVGDFFQPGLTDRVSASAGKLLVRGDRVDSPCRRPAGNSLCYRSRGIRSSDEWSVGGLPPDGRRPTLRRPGTRPRRGDGGLLLAPGPSGGGVGDRLALRGVCRAPRLVGDRRTGRSSRRLSLPSCDAGAGCGRLRPLRRSCRHCLQWVAGRAACAPGRRRVGRGPARASGHVAASRARLRSGWGMSCRDSPSTGSRCCSPRGRGRSVPRRPAFQLEGGARMQRRIGVPVSRAGGGGAMPTPSLTWTSASPSPAGGCRCSV